MSKRLFITGLGFIFILGSILVQMPVLADAGFVSPAESSLNTDQSAKNRVKIIKYPYIKLLSNYKLTLDGEIQRAAISPNGRFALIPDKSNDRLYFITLTGRNPRLEDFRIPTGTAPADVVVSNNARRAYVANEADRTISVIRLDWDGSDTIATIPVDYSPTSLAISRDDKYLYALSRSENMLMVLKLSDSDTQTVNNIKVGSWPVSIKLNDEAKLALIVNQGSNNISKVDISVPEGSLTNSNIPVGTYPCDVAINKKGTLAIATNLISDTLTLFDPSQSLVDSPFTVSDMFRPAGIVTDTTNGIAMLLNSEADRIKFYDLNASTTSGMAKIRHDDVDIAPKAEFISVNGMYKVMIIVNPDTSKLNIVYYRVEERSYKVVEPVLPEPPANTNVLPLPEVAK